MDVLGSLTYSQKGSASLSRAVNFELLYVERQEIGRGAIANRFLSNDLKLQQSLGSCLGNSW